MVGVADDSARWRRALSYWGVVQAATRQRMTTADLWASIRSAAEQFGLDRPGITPAEVNRLRHAAVQERETKGVLERAPGEYALTGEYVTVAPYARSQQERQALPLHQATFRYEAVGEDGSEWRYGFVSFRSGLPATIEDLRSLVGEAAQGLAADYGFELGEIDDLSILEV